jgi:SAM-dependent methyltransferase
MIKDSSFYDTESETYSDKRYPKQPSSYNQFFFIKRLSFVLCMLRASLLGKTGLLLLEIGCADGIVIEKIYEKFSGAFSSIIGIDTSLEMIAVASKRYQGRPFVFKNRADFSDTSLKDVIIEVGVINYADLSEELDFASSRLKENGVYVISLAGTSSLWNRIKKGDKGFRNFLSYSEYEKEINKKFDIVATKSVGFFIPLIWKIPALARIIQPSEMILRKIVPNLFHEKIYLLKKK